MSQIPSNPLLNGLAGFGSGPFGGYNGYGTVIGAWNFPQLAQVDGDSVKEAKKPEKVPELERTTTGLYAGGAYDRFIGYPNTPPGSLSTYRLMNTTSPTLTLVRGMITAPIVSGVPTFQIRTANGKVKTRGPIVGDGISKDPLDQRADLIEQMFMPLWSDFMFNNCRSLAMGHTPYQVEWAIKNGRNWITEFADLPPEWVQLLVDSHRKLLGVRPMANLSGPDLVGWNSFVCTYDNEGRNWHGRPRHENARQEWWRQLQDDLQGSKLDDKASGFTFKVAGPNQNFVVNGQTVSGEQAAQAIAQLLSAGRSVYVENFAFSTQAIAKNPELAKGTMWDIEQFNLGNVGPSQDAILKKLEYRDKRLVRAWGRPEREVLEAARGGIGQGDASAHGDIGIVDTEMIMSMFYGQINRGPINNVLRLNYGQDAIDSVFAKAPPLADPQVDFLQKVVLALAADDQASQELLSLIDTPALMDRTELPSLETPKKLPPRPGDIQQDGGNNGSGATVPNGNKMKVGAALADRMNGKAA